MSYIYDVRGKPFVPCSGCPKGWIPTGLQSLAYWELYCFTDCWRHLRNRWPSPNTAFVAALPVVSCVPGGLFVLKLIPALSDFVFEITISHLQIWSDVVISHSPLETDLQAALQLAAHNYCHCRVAGIAVLAPTLAIIQILILTHILACFASYMLANLVLSLSRFHILYPPKRPSVVFALFKHKTWQSCLYHWPLFNSNTYHNPIVTTCFVQFVHKIIWYMCSAQTGNTIQTNESTRTQARGQK